MGLVQTFLDAFNKRREDIADAKRKETLEHARSDGGSLGATAEGDAGSFDPIQRPAPEPESGDRVDPSDLSVASDPDEGGEVSAPESGDRVTGDLSVTSGDPEEGGEKLPPNSTDPLPPTEIR